MSVTLPSLPLPLIGAIVLMWLGLRAWRVGVHGPWFLALIALCAWQSAVIAAHVHYGLGWLRWAQPLGAALLGPTAWLALVSAGVRPLARWDALHLLVPVGVAAAVLWLPAAIDAVIPVSVLGYGVAMLITLWRGADALPRNSLQGGERAVVLWRVIALGLMLSALAEILIIAAFALGRSDWVGWIIGGFTAGNLAVIGLLSLSGDMSPPPGDTSPVPPADPVRDADDAALVGRLRELIQNGHLHRDPDLTLNRLARRMGVPAKPLSAAINRHTGENVSRLINALRIEDACARLRAGASVTEAMLEAGFNTKSNFNREFRRITGQSPSEWRG